ncbi:MAG: beta-lactamase protein [Gemmatimonadetes bacterium]|nr:beta-lactamase protein [Gemmatimonadota bacterium]
MRTHSLVSGCLPPISAIHPKSFAPTTLSRAPSAPSSNNERAVTVQFALLLSLASALAPEPCRRSQDGDARAIVDRSIGVLGLASMGTGVRTSTVTDVLNMPYQSDRPYPPFLWATRDLRLALEWGSGAQRSEQGTAPNTIAFVSDGTLRGVISPRAAIQVSQRQVGLLDERAMDPWAVLADWHQAADLRVVEECIFRDYWRTVLSRTTAEGMERLYVDPKTGYPIKLERRESHYLWGDVLAEYLWSIWSPVKGSHALAPQFAFRLVDGVPDEQRILEKYATVPRDSVGALSLPANATLVQAPPLPMPDTVRVASNTFLLVTRAYTNVVSLQGDTVYILDAQLGEERAKRDSAWIGKLFPGRHPLVLIVTDLAWPHIAGVRYWVSQGATVVSHSTSNAFLKRVLERKWTLQPDVLEGRRSLVHFNFRPVGGSLSLAGGAIELRAIDGVGSEGALIAFLPRERFLYAGDYMQGGGPDSFAATYAREVVAATQRAGFTPERFAAMHLPLNDWSSLPRFTGQP